MKVLAQMGMVMNLDKCIGCHTCSVTCKQAWTNRAGTEYVWFNNVETRPGQGYPRRYEDQETWRGGWTLNSRGRLKLRTGSRLRRLLTIFSSPVQPKLADYYEPWTYDYQTLIDAPLGDDFPVARPKSLITGEDTKITWSANWDDNLGGVSEQGHLDPMVQRVRRESEDKIKFAFEQTFMFYLPRICEHCLNPSCMASCPSGAIYKRAEDGIVLVDQDRCRGWRQCVTGCPYKKIYFNHKTGKAEKCTLCYPRIEVGLPTVCSETCVGRLRYLATASPAFVERWLKDGLSEHSAARAPCLVFNRKDRLQALWLQRALGTDVVPPVHWLPSSQAFVDAALAGLGWGMNLETMVQEHIRAGRLVALEPSDPLEVPLFWQQSRIVGPLLGDLTRAVIATARTMLSPMPA